MNNNIYEIIALLADGKSRSGQEIGDLLKITRSAVWKIMHKLSELAIKVKDIDLHAQCKCSTKI